MGILFKKNRALSRILRNKFRAPALPARPEHTAPAYSLSEDIPKHYNDTYVRAIPKDPQNTFVYWEMPKEKAAAEGFPASGSVHAESGAAEEIERKLRDDARCTNDGHGVHPQQRFDFNDNSWHWGGGQSQPQTGNNDHQRNADDSRRLNGTNCCDVSQQYNNGNDNNHQSGNGHHQTNNGCQINDNSVSTEPTGTVSESDTGSISTESSKTLLDICKSQVNVILPNLSSWSLYSSGPEKRTAL